MTFLDVILYNIGAVKRGVSLPLNENCKRGVSLPLNENYNSTEESIFIMLSFFLQMRNNMGLAFYEVDEKYINYLKQFENKVFNNSTANAQNTRKYIGILLNINNVSYLAPLSSFKRKHKNRKSTIDMLIIKQKAALNLNNMIPVIAGVFSYVNFKTIKDIKYKCLLENEYKIIKKNQQKIINNSIRLYTLKTKPPKNIDDNLNKLLNRCNNFALLEEKAIQYKKYRV